MLKKFLPNMYVPTVNRIDLGKLESMGIKALIFDVDNTLLPWRERSTIDILVSTLKRFTDKGYKICIVSNARDRKVKELFESINVPIIARAGKPRKRAFKKALQKLKVIPSEAAFVGDQVFTDILGGNRAGLYTILVIPISRREFIGTKIARKLEKRVLNHFIKKGVLTRPRF